MVYRKVYDAGSDIPIDQEWYSDPDEFLRPTKTTYLDASTRIEVRQGCCNLAYSIDREGVATTNSYDALKRQVAVTRLGITTSNLLDAAGRLRSQTRLGTSGSPIPVRSLGYDAAGRVVRETNAFGAVTSHAYSVDAYAQAVSALGSTSHNSQLKRGGEWTENEYSYSALPKC